MKISANHTRALKQSFDRNSSPKIVVTALLDGLSDPELEGAVARDLDQLQKAQASPDLEFSASIYRAGMKISKGDVLSWAGKTVAAIGLGVAAIVASPLVGGALTAVAAGYALWPKAGGSFAKNWFGAGKMGIAHYKHFKGDPTRGHLQASGPSLKRLETPEKVSLEPWKDSLISNMKSYPAARHVVFALGHGLGFESMAERATGAWGTALEEAAQESGRKADVLVLESCNMANLEGLSAMRKGARYAIASPQAIQTGNHLAESVAEKLGDKDKSLLETSQEMVASLGDDTGLPELGLFDLKAMDKELWPALDETAKALRQDMDPARAEMLLGAITKADRAGQEGMKFRDLGSFLEQLSQTELEPSTLRSVAKAQEALGKTELSEDSNGLSFAPFPTLTAEQPYEELNISESWKELFLDLSYFRVTKTLRHPTS